MYFIQANLIIYQIFLSKSLQDLWAMLNTQSITIHMMIFRCSQTIPANLQGFNYQMSEFTQKDMYPTDLIYGGLFNFTAKDSPFEHFEFLGYEGANFVELSGSAIINIGIAFGVSVFLNIVNWFCVKIYTIPLARKIGSKIQTTSSKAAILTIYLQSFLEMMICAALSIQALGYDDFYSGNKSDLFAAIFVICSSLILVVLPLYMFYVIWFNFDTLDRADTIR